MFINTNHFAQMSLHFIAELNYFEATEYACWIKQPNSCLSFSWKRVLIAEFDNFDWKYTIWGWLMLYIRYVFSNKQTSFNFIKRPGRHLYFIKKPYFNKLKITNLSANCNSCFYHVHICRIVFSMHWAIWIVGISSKFLRR